MSKVTPIRRRGGDDPPTEYDGGNAIMALAARAVAEGAQEAIILYVTEDGSKGWWPSDGMMLEDGLILSLLVHRGLMDSFMADDENE